MRTWKVLEWPDPPENPAEFIPIVCPKCRTEAMVPVAIKMPLIAILPSNGLVFDPSDYDPPENAMPRAIQCRTCKTILSDPKEKKE